MKLLLFIFSILLGMHSIAMESSEGSFSSKGNAIDHTEAKSSVRSLKELAIQQAASAIAETFLNKKGKNDAYVNKIINQKTGLSYDHKLFQPLKNAAKRRLAQQLFIDKVFNNNNISGIQIEILNMYVATINNFKKEKYFLLRIHNLRMNNPIYSEKFFGFNEVKINRISKHKEDYIVEMACRKLSNKIKYYKIKISEENITKTEPGVSRDPMIYSFNSDEEKLYTNNNGDTIFKAPIYKRIMIKNTSETLRFIEGEPPFEHVIHEYNYTDPEYLGNHSIVTDQSGKKILISTATGQKRLDIDGSLKKISENIYLLEKRDGNKNDALFIFDEFSLPKKIDTKRLKIEAKSIKKAFKLQPNPIAYGINGETIDFMDRELYLLKEEPSEENSILIVHQDSGKNIVFDLNNLNSNDEPLNKYKLPAGNIYRVSAFCFIIITPENLIPKVLFFENIKKILEGKKTSLMEVFLPSNIEKNLKNEGQWQFFTPHVTISSENWEKFKIFFRYPYAICKTPEKKYLIPLIPNNLSFEDIIEIGKNLNKEDSPSIKKLQESNFLLWTHINYYNDYFKNKSVKKSMPIKSKVIDDRALFKEKKVKINNKELKDLKKMDASKIIKDQAQSRTLPSNIIKVDDQVRPKIKPQKKELDLPELNQEPKKGPISGLWQRARRLWYQYFKKQAD